jgi:hypothetical protein
MESVSPDLIEQPEAQLVLDRVFHFRELQLDPRRSGTLHRVFLDRIGGDGAFSQSQRGGFVTEAQIGQREISDEDIIFQVFFEERFQFAARLSPPQMTGTVYRLILPLIRIFLCNFARRRRRRNASSVYITTSCLECPRPTPAGWMLVTLHLPGSAMLLAK